MRPGEEICHDSLSTCSSFFSPQKGKCAASLHGKCDLSTKLLLSSDQYGARSSSRLAINADLSAIAQLLASESAAMITKTPQVDFF